MTTTIPPVPRLEDDAGYELDAGALIERQLCWALLHTMRQAFPEERLYVDDGEELQPADSLKHAMDLVFSVGDAHIHFGRNWVRVICGNEVDFISDYVLRPGVEQAVREAERHVGTRQEDD